MSKHTPEPWPTFINCCEPSTPVPDSDPIVRLGFDDYNMARTCVNACKGMAKSDLDNMVIMGETLLDRFGMFNGEIAELKRQRDELLALSEELEGWLSWMWTPADAAERSVTHNLLNKTRKVISKTKGPAA